MLRILVLNQGLDLLLPLLEALLCLGVLQHLELYSPPILPSLLLLQLLDLGNPKSHLLLHFHLKALQLLVLDHPDFQDFQLLWQQDLLELQRPQPLEAAVLQLVLVVQAHSLTLLFPSHPVAPLETAAYPPLSHSQMAAPQQIMYYSHPGIN